MTARTSSDNAAASKLYRYGVPLVAVAAAVLLKVLIEPFQPTPTPYLSLGAAVMVSAWFGGLHGGLTATFVCALFVAVRFQSSGYTAHVELGRDAISLSLFTAEGALISWLTSALQRAKAERRRGLARETLVRDELHAGHERYRSLVESTAAIFWTTDAQGAFVTPQPSWEAYTGQPWKAHSGWGWLEAIHPDDRDRVKVLWKAALRRGEICESEGRLWHAASSDYRFFAARGVPVASTDGPVAEWIGTCTDVHDRKLAEDRAEAAKRETAQTLALLDSLLRNAPVGFAFFDRERRYVRVNAFLAEMNGVPADEHLGRTVRDIAPANADSIEPVLDRVVETGSPVVNVEIRGQTPARPGEWRDWLCGFYPVVTALGHVIYVGAVVTEITERKRAEQVRRESEDRIRRMNEELERRVSERTLQLQEALRELESFAYSVSHDLRAPLRHINGFAEMLLKHGGDLNNDGRRYAQIIVDTAGKGGRMVDELLAFSRMGRVELHKASVNTRQIVDELREGLVADLNGRTVIWEVGPLPEVYGDPTLLRLVFQNLLLNAVKYTRPRREARIAVSASQDGDLTVFSIRDNGVGFDMRYVDKLFGVFQRLHGEQEFEGNGIGLANVRRIVNRHGGRTWAEGRLDEGAAFFFSLPTGPS